MATDNSADASTDIPSDGIDTIDFERGIQMHLEGQEDDSHTEWNPSVFHPSQVGYHPWLMYVNKLGLSDKSDLLGTFQTGTLIHEFMEEVIDDHPRGNLLGVEEPIDFEEDGLSFTGRYDCYDAINDVVYDFKTRKNWYNFDPPVDRHVDQLHTYMRGVNADYGQLVYVSKGDLEVRTWPEGAPFTFSEGRWADIRCRCRTVRDAIIDQGYATAEAEIPFKKPSSDHPQHYFVSSTDLDFSSVGVTSHARSLEQGATSAAGDDDG